MTLIWTEVYCLVKEEEDGEEEEGDEFEQEMKMEMERRVLQAEKVGGNFQNESIYQWIDETLKK